MATDPPSTSVPASAPKPESKAPDAPDASDDLTPGAGLGGGFDIFALRANMKAMESFLDDAYCAFSCQVGYRTDGHQCIDVRDREEAFQAGSSLLYGEVLPHGVASMLEPRHLDARHSRSLFDLGMGTGKLALQAFLQHPSLRRVVGIELAFSRYRIGEKALLNMVSRHPRQFVLVSWKRGRRVCIASTADGRTIEFRRGDLLGCSDVGTGDIVIVQTDFPSHSYPLLCRFLTTLERGARLLTYLNLRRVWDCGSQAFPFSEIAPKTRFATSWSAKTGHLFYLWKKSAPRTPWAAREHAAEGKEAEAARDRRRGGQKSKSQSRVQPEGGGMQAKARSWKHRILAIFGFRPGRATDSRVPKLSCAGARRDVAAAGRRSKPRWSARASERLVPKVR
jgi:hypothetical protein